MLFKYHNKLENLKSPLHALISLNLASLDDNIGSSTYSLVHQKSKQ